MAKSYFDKSLEDDVKMVKPQLNEPVAQYKFFPEEGGGSYLSNMPLLLVEGCRPLSFADGMRERVRVAKHGSDAVKSGWWDNGFWTIDGVARPANSGGVKVVLDSYDLRNVNATSKLSPNGGLILPNGVQSLKGVSFTERNVKKYGNRPNNRRQAKNNPFWKTLANDDQELLNDYVDVTFDTAKARWDLSELMAVYFADAEGVDTLRPWWLSRLDDYNYDGSSAYGCNLLDINGRVVGVSDGVAQSVSPRSGVREGRVVVPNLEDVLSATRRALEPLYK